MKCPVCNKEIGTIDQVIDHLGSSHFLNYQNYCENSILVWNKSDEPTCFNCGNLRAPLTWLEREFYYLPCRSCLKRKSDFLEAKNEIIKNIKQYYKKIIGDRHFQLFVLDDIYLHKTFPHDFETFSKVLKLLDLPKDRDELWFLDWKKGYPKLLCPENIKGIELISLTKYFNKFKNEDDKILVGDYEIRMPEKILYDSKHHFRYNILNKNSDTRRTKRLRLPGDENNCIKFYISGEDWNSIFRLYKNGEVVNLDKISHLDTLIIKLAIFRNKNFLRLLFDIIYELLSNISSYRDGIFLKNTVLLDPDKDLTLNLSWFPDNSKLNKEVVNISIL